VFTGRFFHSRVEVSLMRSVVSTGSNICCLNRTRRPRLARSSGYIGVCALNSFAVELFSRIRRWTSRHWMSG
jgi:hypothetical protein